MKLDPITVRIEQLSLAMHAEAGDPSPELQSLFQALRTTEDSRLAAASEERIWAIWCAHEDMDAARAMHDVIDGFASGEPQRAAATLDTMVARWPDWAEAWNKRATLRFIQERDGDSLDDIGRTLTLEPRHFGALGGFGQICLRAGDPVTALLAFERALAINPHLEGIRHAVQTLALRTPRTVH